MLLVAAPHAAFAEGRMAKQYPHHSNCRVNHGEHDRFGRPGNCHRR
jgi:hypothetical protein